jgi:hypothetical protein
MKGDIALAGFVLTAEEWEALDPLSRAQLMAEEWQLLDPIARTQLMAMLSPRSEPWVVARGSGVLSVAPEGSAPNLHVPTDDDDGD